MKIQSLVKKNLRVLVLITVIYFLYVSFFLKPWQLTNFSLVDDGQVLIQSSSYLEECVLGLKCSKFIDQTFELGTNRFRPTYWLINNIVYEVFRNDVMLHHIFRVYVVGYISLLLLSLVIIDLGVSSLFTIIGVLVFATNYSFSENIIRLGTNEPYQMVFLALFSLFYLRTLEKRNRKKKIPRVLIFALILTLLIKESSIAILPVIFITEILVFGKKAFKRIILLVGIPFLIFFSGIIITRLLPSTISSEIPVYTSNYVTNLKAINENSKQNLILLTNSLSPFFKISPFLLIFLLLNKPTRLEFKETKVYFWSFFAVFFTIILFPWKFVLERYQLVAVFGISILLMFLFDRTAKFVWKSLLPSNNERIRILFQISTIIVTIGLFLRGIPLNLAKTINYQSWYFTVTQFEKDQVDLMARYKGERVFINAKDNITNWEWLYEIPIHLKNIYRIETSFELLKESIPNDGYIFSQTTFDTKYSKKELIEMGYVVSEMKLYHIPHIDPLEFRRRFFSQPISTIIIPPVENYHEYWWEIGEVD